MDFRFLRKTGRAADITAMTEIDPQPPTTKGAPDAARVPLPRPRSARGHGVREVKNCPGTRGISPKEAQAALRTLGYGVTQTDLAYLRDYVGV
jgi:hypothetical protein